MSPYLLQTKSIMLPAFSAMISVAFFTGGLIFWWLASGRGYSTRLIFGWIFTMQAAGLVGARALYLWTQPAQMQDFFSLTIGGFAVHGGILLSILAGLGYCAFFGVSFLDFADLSSPALAIGIPITKAGCFLGGCCFGLPASSLLAVTFPEGSPAALYYGLPHLIHPAQLYEGLGGILLFFVSLHLLRRRSRPGAVFLPVLIVYMFIRFINDYFRIHNPSIDSLSLTMTQIFAVCVMVIAAGCSLYLRRSPAKNST